MRCLPWKRDARANYTPTDVVYIDARCSTPVALFKAGAALPEYALADPEVVPCALEADRYSVRRVGEKLTDIPGNVYYQDGTECHLLGSVSLSAESLTAVRLAEVAPPELFVAAERVPTESAERLSSVECPTFNIGIFDVSATHDRFRCGALGVSQQVQGVTMIAVRVGPCARSTPRVRPEPGETDQPRVRREPRELNSPDARRCLEFEDPLDRAGRN